MQLQQKAQQTCPKVTDDDIIICGTTLTDAVLNKKKRKEKSKNSLKVSAHINGLNSVQNVVLTAAFFAKATQPAKHPIVKLRTDEVVQSSTGLSRPRPIHNLNSLIHSIVTDA